ncbi:phosphatase PAP2 family protein [Deinococcus roseus]|uniref:Phosphatidylglycerophosphatase B n=1 Tax=Deinococcus roseus TaxID=392414 RepID=A0ABQ2DID7_9DEIO|nr:phosphatase PAP2 family protein [Deinococcus roseus]GGJ57611.1 phosphatidylglycerophosphatase B [Deinococcus roseus]
MNNQVGHTFQLHWKSLTIWILGVLLPLLGVGLIAEDLMEKQIFAFEEPFMRLVHTHATPTLDALALTFSFVGSVNFIGPLSLVICLIAWKKSSRYGLYFLLATLGAAGMNILAKMVFNRTRPQFWERLVNEPAASFPSGHAMFSAALATALIAMLWHTRYRWMVFILGVGFALCVGLSRIYLGVHYPTDVLCGWAAGMAWSLACWRIFKSHHSTDPEKPTPDEASSTAQNA